EDGIRAGHVTGVQTCALPIYPRRPAALRPASPAASPAAAPQAARPRAAAVPPRAAAPLPRQRQATMADRLGEALLELDAITRRRSEERRVGKECRSGMWTAPY